MKGRNQKGLYWRITGIHLSRYVLNPKCHKQLYSRGFCGKCDGNNKVMICFTKYEWPRLNARIETRRGNNEWRGGSPNDLIITCIRQLNIPAVVCHLQDHSLPTRKYDVSSPNRTAETSMSIYFLSNHIYIYRRSAVLPFLISSHITFNKMIFSSTAIPRNHDW